MVDPLARLVPQDSYYLHLRDPAVLLDVWEGLGTWGGSIPARYETTPPDWIKPYECYLSVREIDRDYWFNLTRTVQESKNVSDATAKIIDEEVRRIVEDGQERATAILSGHRDHERMQS